MWWNTFIVTQFWKWSVFIFRWQMHLRNWCFQHRFRSCWRKEMVSRSACGLLGQSCEWGGWMIPVWTGVELEIPVKLESKRVDHWIDKSGFQKRDPGWRCRLGGWPWGRYERKVKPRIMDELVQEQSVKRKGRDPGWGTPLIKAGQSRIRKTRVKMECSWEWKENQNDILHRSHG